MYNINNRVHNKDSYLITGDDLLGDAVINNNDEKFT
jgi:hypothetical protein